jgi:Ca2+-binding RTX toxin-like protein
MHEAIHRKRCRRPRLSLLLGIGALVAVTVPALGSAGPPTPACHGRPATVVGTPGSDSLRRQDVDDGAVIVLLGGNDRVYDDAKNVTICGGSGSDEITALGRANGRKTVFDGGRDTDYLISGFPRPGNYPGTRAPLHLFGGKGHDELAAGRRDDTIKGGSGDDGPIWGLNGSDVMRGGPGDDSMHGHGGKDRLYGNGGRDKLFGGSRMQSDRSRDRADGGRNSDRCRAEVKRRCER